MWRFAEHTFDSLAPRSPPSEIFRDRVKISLLAMMRRPARLTLRLAAMYESLASDERERHFLDLIEDDEVRESITAQ